MKTLAPHWGGALLALGLFLAAGLAVLDDYAVSGDSPWNRGNAEINLGYLAGGDFRAYLAAFGVDHDKFYGMAFEVPLLFAERAFGLEDSRSIRSVDFPAAYLPVWFSITGPPFALLLGAVGAAGIIVGAARAPRKALRSGRLRFALLLVGCFAGPVFVVMLPGGNIYNGWRQMFFLWAPFALLGAFGLQWLVSALGRRRLRAAAYGAAGAGFAATVISMALLHPNQQEHFNFLVDRVTPDSLRSQYWMRHWGQPLLQGFEWVIERTAQSSGEPSGITASRPVDWSVFAAALLLPESARAPG